MRPYRDRLDIGILERMLPFWLRTMLPYGHVGPQNQPPGSVDIRGIPGLRATHENDHIVLHLLGQAGQIRIRADEPPWDKALFIAKLPWTAEVIDLGSQAPGDWTHLEIEAFRRWKGAMRFRPSRLASDTLRRLPGICKPASSHDLWEDLTSRGFAGGYRFNIEWVGGRSFAPLLNLLLDPDVGMDVEIEPLASIEQTLDDCYADECTYVRLVGRDNPHSRLTLRRSLYNVDADTAEFDRRWKRDHQDQRRAAELLYQRHHLPDTPR